MAERFQHQVIFWLNLMDREQEILADYIAELKARKKFAPTVRLALALLRDLDEGNVDVLRDMFPDIADRLTATSLEDIKQLIRETQPEVIHVPAQPAGQPRTIEAPQFSAPVFEEDDDTLLLAAVKVEAAGKKAGVNFLNSLNNLQQ